MAQHNRESTKQPNTNKQKSTYTLYCILRKFTNAKNYRRKI